MIKSCHVKWRLKYLDKRCHFLIMSSFPPGYGLRGEASQPVASEPNLQFNLTFALTSKTVQMSPLLKCYSRQLFKSKPITF